MLGTEPRIRWTIAAFQKLLSQARAEGWGTPGERVDTPTVELGGDDSLTRLHDLAISPIDIDALWLLVCCELEPVLARLAHSLGTPELPDLSVALWFRLVECATSCELPAAAIDRLLALGLIETTKDPRLPSYRRWVRASDRVVELARGDDQLDREVAEFACLVPCEIGGQAPATLHQAFDRDSLIMVVGPPDSGRATLLGNVAGRNGRPTLRVRCPELSDGERLVRSCRSIAREARLFGAVVMVEDLDALPEPARRTLDRELFAKSLGPVLATSREELQIPTQRTVVTHRVQLPTKQERIAIWRTALTGATDEVVEKAADAYAIGPGAIVAAAASARAAVNGAVTVENVHDGLRAHLDRQLGSIATRVTCTQTWNDLVLPVEQFEQIAELVARVEHRRRVLDDWGFAAKVGRGVGVAALLSGPPGTGKTMVAGLVAKELGLDLYQVDLSKVVSKYIGETEKNLATVFDAAESGHAVILFDEADSLFAKRSEVKSSNDRYANLEVNYLLQRIEQFTGISMLTTNHESAIDEAFRRRLAIHLRFPIPDEEQRRLLWEAVIPANAPIGDIDVPELARDYAMTGGYIKNAAVRAAYLAVGQGEIQMHHLRRAARAEYVAMGKVVREAA